MSALSQKSIYVSIYLSNTPGGVYVVQTTFCKSTYLITTAELAKPRSKTTRALWRVLSSC